MALQTESKRVVSNSQLMKVHPLNQSSALIKDDQGSVSTIQGIQSEEHKILEGEFVYPLSKHH